MQVRSLAFQHVEFCLEKLLAGHTKLPSIGPGVMVELFGLKAEQLNGEAGICLASADLSENSGNRCTVQLRNGRLLSVKEENLKPVDEQMEETSDDENDCAGGG